MVPDITQADEDIYTKEEAMEDAVEKFNGDNMAADTFLSKYSLQLPTDEVENGKQYLETTPQEMWARMAKEGAKVEEDEEYWRQQFYNIFEDFTAVPQGSIMFALGNEQQDSSLSNCFVLPIEDDNLEDIFETAKRMARTYSYRGGVGTDISILRPKDSVVHNAARQSTGAVSFMDFYSYVTNLIGQKCIAEDQRVLTDDGYQEIKNIEKGNEVWTKEGFLEVSDKINTGKKETYEVTDKYGYTIETSIDHKFLTVDNEGGLEKKPLEDLGEGEEIILIPGDRKSKGEQKYVELEDTDYEKVDYGNKSNKLKEDYTFPDELNEDLAYALGVMYGDGHFEFDDQEEPYCLSVGFNSNKEISGKYIEIMEDLFNCNLSIKEREDENTLDVALYSKLICHWLFKNNINKEKSADISIPDKIDESPKSVQMSFISGYFDADGYASGSKKGYVFNSICKDFLRDIQDILMKYGVISKMHVEDRSSQGWNDLYSLTVTGKIAQERFVEDCQESLKVKRSGYVSKRDYVMTPYKSQDFEIKRHNHSFMPDNSQYHSSSCFYKTKEASDEEMPNLLVKSKIRNIESCGEKQTYDISLDKEHLFMCEGYYTSNSRRGALMITISDKHPDLYHPEADGMDFINIKRDLDKVTGANISVKFSDAFMNAVKNDEQWVLKWERKDDEVFVGEGQTREKIDDSEGPDLCVRREYPAQEIWDNVVESATECAEPGVIFWDKMKNDPPYGQYEEHEPLTTNPCQPGWAPVMTKNGLTKMEYVEEGDEVWSKEGWSTVSKKWDNGVQDVYQYVTTAGTFYGTENHKVEDSGNKVAVKNAEFIDLCDGPDVDIDLSNHDDQLVMDGLVLGDGGLEGGQSKKIVLYIGEDDHDYFDSEVEHLIGDIYNESKQNYKVETTVNPDEVPAPPEREIPDRYKFADKDDVASVLRGIYSANGSICDKRVTLKSTSIDVIRDVQDMLQSLGIRSYYTTNKPSKVDWHNGTYESKESYDLNISSHRKRFYNKIGFIQDYKMDKLKNRMSDIRGHRKNSYPIVEKQKISKEKVYDIEVDNDSHTYCTNGLSVSNCSEIPLSPNDACTLLSINLTNFVKHPFSESAEIDYDSLKSVASVATRFLDNIKGIDAEDVPFEEQKEAALSGRRLGLGTHGLGDMLAMLGVKYDSEEAKEICDELYKKYKHFIYEASADLAEEKGPFPLYDYDKHMNSPFMQRLANENPELADKIKDQGLRNCGLLTCAPTGSVSMISQTSSGIEPIFRLKYKRNVRTGDEMKTFDVFHHLVQDYLDKEGIDIDPETTTEEELKDILPDYFQTAETIDHPKRAELQGVLQEHIDHSISSCITEDMMVMTDSGLLYPDEIIDSDKQGFCELDKNYSSINHKNKEAEFDQGYVNGESKNIRLKMKNGFEQAGTKDHKVKVLTEEYEQEWRELQDIEEGDYIVSRIGLDYRENRLCDYNLEDLAGIEFDSDVNGKDVNVPEDMTKDLARLIGYVCSDGYVNNNGFGLAHSEDNASKHFVELVEDIFGVTPSKTRDERANSLYTWQVNSRELRDFFRWLGCEGERIPIVIRRSNQTIIKEFIRGLTLDGYVSDDKVCIMSDSREDFVRGLFQMVTNLGINGIFADEDCTPMESPTNNKTYDTDHSYSVLVTGQEAHKFISNIGFVENDKKEASKDLLVAYGANFLPGIVPDYGIRELVNDKKSSKVGSKEFSNYLNSFGRPSRHGMDIKRDTLKKIEDFGFDLPDIVTDETYIFRKVKDIKEEEGMTYDFSVPNGHSYIANGNVNHNTINIPGELDNLEEVVSDSYFGAWKSGTKGYTIYVDDSRDDAPLETGEQEPTEVSDDMKYKGDTRVWEVEDDSGHYFIVEGADQIFLNGFSNAHDRMNPDDVNLGNAMKHALMGNIEEERLEKYNERAGFDPIERIARLTSLALKTENASLIKNCFEEYKSKSNLAEMLNNIFNYREIEAQEECPECGEELIHKDGCVECSACHYSRCGV